MRVAEIERKRWILGPLLRCCCTVCHALWDSAFSPKPSVFGESIFQGKMIVWMNVCLIVVVIRKGKHVIRSLILLGCSCLALFRIISCLSLLSSNWPPSLRIWLFRFVPYSDGVLSFNKVRQGFPSTSMCLRLRLLFSKSDISSIVGPPKSAQCWNRSWRSSTLAVLLYWSEFQWVRTLSYL